MKFGLSCLAALAVLLPAFAGEDSQDAALDFAALSEGSWTSLAQSADPGYDWVESETVRIMSERGDGVWLYQENAIMAASPDADIPRDAKSKPYFQVVIRLQSLGPDQVHTTTYRLETPEARSGAKGQWRTGAGVFDPAWVGAPACMGQMRRVAEGYWQGAAECPNTYKGAARVDSRSVRTPDTYVNWDRGFDGEGQNVWGPPRGGYIFKRKGDAQ